MERDLRRSLRDRAGSIGGNLKFSFRVLRTQKRQQPDKGGGGRKDELADIRKKGGTMKR